MIVVYGRWPRSGTSLIMRMLTAGGLTPVTDDDGAASAAHPVGSLQHSVVLTGNTVEALAQWTDAPGRQCVKLFSQQMRALMDVGLYPSQVIVASRDWDEYAASWDAAFPDRARNPDRFGMEMEAEGVIGLLAAAEVPILEVDFHALVDDPAATASAIGEFIGGLDLSAMAAIPDPTHRHFGPAEA